MPISVENQDSSTESPKTRRGRRKSVTEEARRSAGDARLESQAVISSTTTETLATVKQAIDQLKDRRSDAIEKVADVIDALTCPQLFLADVVSEVKRRRQEQSVVSEIDFFQVWDCGSFDDDIRSIGTYNAGPLLLQ